MIFALPSYARKCKDGNVPYQRKVVLLAAEHVEVQHVKEIQSYVWIERIADNGFGIRTTKSLARDLTGDFRGVS